jgi:cyclophilin family peptidyl-prolyl cis-trans isomerase
MRPTLPLFAAGLLAAVAPALYGVDAPGPALPDGLYAVWETSRGSFTAELFYELVPLTVANFVGLTEGTIPFTGRPAGQPFYDGLTFHRVVPGFVVQGGDPLGTGEGDPGHKFADEFTPLLKHDATGILSMANAGPNDNGCQFFFTLSPVNRLNYKHSVFGRVVRGLEVLPTIQVDDVMTRVSILRVGTRARSFRADAASFAALQRGTPVIPPLDAAQPPLFTDEAALSLREGYADWLNPKLHHYAAVTGVTIRVRLVPKFTPPAGDAASAPGTTVNPLRAVHEQLAGNDPRAATLIFLADDQRWRLWLGDGLLARFGLQPGAVGADPGAKQLHDLKQAILAEAKKLWDTPDEPRHRAVDAAVTNLIEALDRPASMKPAGQ